jgi:hypothetical protein
MTEACLGGHKEDVELIISKGANKLDYGMHLALRGHEESH